MIFFSLACFHSSFTLVYIFREPSSTFNGSFFFFTLYNYKLPLLSPLSPTTTITITTVRLYCTTQQPPLPLLSPHFVKCLVSSLASASLQLLCCCTIEEACSTTYAFSPFSLFFILFLFFILLSQWLFRFVIDIM